MPESSPAKTASSTAALENRILAERLRSVAEHLVGIGIASPVALGAAAYVLDDVVPRMQVLYWLAFALATYFFTLVAGLAYLRLRPPPEQSNRWLQVFAFRGLFAGLGWGAAPVMMWPPDRFDYQILVLLFMIGASCVGIITNAAVKRCVLGVFAGVWVPMLWRLFTQDQAIYHTLGIMSLTFCFMMLASMIRLSRQLHDAIRWRFENAALADNLRREQTRAEAASRAKSKFLAAASHDLRQPVHALGFFLQTLRLAAERQSLDRQKFIDITRQSQGTLSGLTGLLDTLLDVSRLEAGIVSREVSPVAVQGVFNALSQQFGERAKRKGLKLTIRPSTAYARTNPLALQRILSNLVENAIRYTRQGGVLVVCRERGNKLLIQVWDTGSGIPAEELDAIFQEFYQIEQPRAAAEGGLGLGLSIVRQLADLFGHHLSVRSRVGRGSRFTVSLRRDDPQLPEGGDSPTIAPSMFMHVGAFILVVDDDDDSLDAHRELLAQAGYRVMAARSGNEALALVTSQGVPLAGIVTDYRLMHNRTGFEVIDAVQRAVGRKLPAMIITGDTQPELIAEIASHGYQVQHKPMPPGEFLRAVRELVSRV